MTLVNDYVIYVHNLVKQKLNPLCRRDFAKQVCEELTRPHLEARLQTPGLHKNLKHKIEEIIGEKAPANEPEHEEQAATRTMCGFCPSKKRRMTKCKCLSCKRFYCLKHRASMCVDCT